jgi:hypothetical protein
VTVSVIDGQIVERVHATDSDLAYMAGIVDGEGTVYYREKTGSLRVSVTNTHRPLLDWIAERWGGSVNDELNYTGDGCTRKPKWRWTLSGGPAVVLLRELLPRLIVKAERAVHGIERWEER